jgi:hypothetical protein
MFSCLCSENQPDIRHHQLPKTKPLPSIESLGQPPPKPAKPPTVNLQAFQRQPAATSKTPKEGKEMHRASMYAQLYCLYHYITSLSIRTTS